MNLPEATSDNPFARRKRRSTHVRTPPAAWCHRLMDPIGFGLESFDAIGRQRQHETILIESPTGNRKDEKKIDLDLDTRGEIAGIPASVFTDSRQLGGILAQSPVCQECMVRQIFRYAYGRLETSSDEETIHRLFARFRDSGFHFKDLLIALVQSSEFLAGLNDNQEGVIRTPGPTRRGGKNATR